MKVTRRQILRAYLEQALDDLAAHAGDQYTKDTVVNWLNAKLGGRWKIVRNE